MIFFSLSTFYSFRKYKKSGEKHNLKLLSGNFEPLFKTVDIPLPQQFLRVRVHCTGNRVLL